MTSKEQSIRSGYLCPPVPGLWQWQDRGDAITWVSGDDGIAEETAAMAGQLHLVLSGLAKRVGQLPALTSALFVLNACSDRWTAERCRKRLLALESKWHPSGKADFETKTDRLNSIIQWFADIQSLPKDLRQGVESQIALLEFVLAGCPHECFELKGNAMEDMLVELGLSSEDRSEHWGQTFQLHPPEYRVKQVWQSLHSMTSVVIDKASLRDFQRTAVTKVPIPGKAGLIEEPPSRPISELLSSLRVDAELCGIASAAMDVSSLLAIPHRPSDPSDLPTGGVSDVVNRGAPERLLFTELAQPPMVLLARIATGQALYLRRESPPGPSPNYRPVLIESTIRTWGKKRCQAIAIALAVGAIDERLGKPPTRFWTIQGRLRYQENLASREGVVQQLERLSTDEQPGEAMLKWLEAAREEQDVFAEPIVIASEATESDPRFRIALDEMPVGTLLARIESDNVIRLIRRTSRGQETLQQLLVDVDQRVSESGTQVHLDKADNLYLNQQLPPLRTSDTCDGMWMVAIDQSRVLAITADRRLLLYDEPQSGAIEVNSVLPARTVVAYEVREDAIRVVLKREQNRHFLIRFWLDTFGVDIVPIDDCDFPSPKYAIDRGSLLRFSKEVELIDADGHVQDTIPLGSDQKHFGGPVIADPNRFYVLTEQSGKIVQHRLSCDVIRKQVASFVRNRFGKVVPLVMDLNEVFGAPLDVIAHSTNRQWFVVRQHNDANSTYWVNQVSGESLTRTHVSNMFFVSRFDQAAIGSVQLRQLLKQVNAVCIATGQLGIQLKRNREKKFARASNGHLVIQAESRSGRSHALSNPYSIKTTDGTSAWKLRSVDLGNNRVIMDSRGLLHLIKGSDRSEMTLALDETIVSGWTSWGEVFGNRYFTGQADCPPSDDVFHWLNEFTRQCLVLRSNSILG
ncbi:hypothetical protein LOC67_00270 [Stieleria sp. JC731]|uniref:hypothetical protein n=1 Tax=Pirellulaceae TaxID=2691357 RepID=UPI001E2D13EE|nr:hypothetical protein [Stieleria sp. JC731]MCC9598974.1 hypothetical protein [Stieleria sp. JC731]